MNNTSFATIKGQVTIPIHIRKRLNINKGSRVIFTENKGETIIKKAPDFFTLKGSINSTKKFSESTIDKQLRDSFKQTYE